MKNKIFSFVIAICLLIPCLFLVGCHEHTYSEDLEYDATHHWYAPTCECEVEVKDKAEHTLGDLNYIEEDGKVYKVLSCDTCEYEAKTEMVGAIVATTTQEAEVAVCSDEDDAIIYLAAGNYGVIEFKNGVMAEQTENLTIVANDGAIVQGIMLNVHQKYAPKNLVIDNVYFNNNDESKAGGVVSYIQLDGLTVSNCYFENGARVCLANTLGNVFHKNVVIKDNTFKNISNSSNQLTAIYLQTINGVKIENNYFDGVDYNAIQVNAVIENSEVLVKGNTFKDVGSRVIYFTEVANKVVHINIEDNTFYSKEDNLTKADGNYICSKMLTVNVGANKWEKVPAKDTKYFSECVNIDINAQLSI